MAVSGGPMLSVRTRAAGVFGATGTAGNAVAPDAERSAAFGKMLTGCRALAAATSTPIIGGERTDSREVRSCVLLLRTTDCFSATVMGRAVAASVSDANARISGGKGAAAAFSTE